MKKQFIHAGKTEQILTHIEIRGWIYSKKNSSNFGINPKTGRMTSFGNPAYNRSKKGYKEQILKHFKQDKPLTGPLTAWVLCWGQNEKWVKQWSKGNKVDRYCGWDIDNKLGSLFDLLQYAKVVSDDCQILATHACKHHGKGLSGSYGAKVWLTRFTEGGFWCVD